MPESFKSFQEMGQSFAQAEAEEKKRKEDGRKERFAAAFDGQFESFAQGNFKSGLPGLESITITRPRADSEGKVANLNITIFGMVDGKQLHETLTLDGRGALHGRVPRWLKASKDELYDEVLKIGETVSQNFFEPINDDILPEGEWIVERGQQGLPEQPDGKSKGETDLKRLQFMQRQPKVLFGIRGMNSGFRGYYGFVFPDKIIFENDQIANAVYFVKLEGPLPFEPNKAIPKTVRRKIIVEKIKPFLGLSKKEILEKGAARVIHPPNEDKLWEEKMSQLIAG